MRPAASVYASSMSDTAVVRNVGSVTLHGAGPAASTEYIVPVTSAHVTPIAAPVIGLAPTSPVIAEAGTSVTPAFVSIAKPAAVPSNTGAGPAAVAAPVVKLHVNGAANALPARSLIPVVSVAVYRVLAARLLVGFKVATAFVEVTVPETGVAPCVKVKFAAVIVAGSTASLKVAAMLLLTTTPVAVLAGSVELTVGAVVSAVAPVVKFHVLLTANALPAKSLTPVVIVAV